MNEVKSDRYFTPGAQFDFGAGYIVNLGHPVSTNERRSALANLIVASEANARRISRSISACEYSQPFIVVTA